MLDIDINFLNFLLNPTYEYIKNDIEIIKKSYIKDPNQLKRTFPDINYFFLNKTSTINLQIKRINEKITEEVYTSFANLLGIKLNSDKNNFIEIILQENNIYEIKQDYHLTIFKNKIVNYLKEIIIKSNNQKEKELAIKTLQHAEILLEKADLIYNVLDEKEKLTNKTLNKIKEIKENIKKQIIKEHSYLLSDNAKNIIINNPNYNISELLKNEDVFNMFFSIYNNNDSNIYFPIVKTGSIIDLNLKNLQNRNGITYNQNTNKYLKKIETDIKNKLKNLKYKYISNGVIYEKEKIYDKLTEDINKYNELCCKMCEEYTFTIPKTEILEKYQNIIKNDINTKNHKFESPEELNLLLSNSTNNFWNEISKGSNIGTYWKVAKIMALSVLETCSIIPNYNDLITNFYFLLSHELGHAYDYGIYILEKDGVVKQDKYRENEYGRLYEIYNDYRSIKKTINLISQDYLTKKGIIHSQDKSLYSEEFFWLIDLFETYEAYFEEYATTGNIETLEKIFKENLDETIKLINELDFKLFDKDIEYTKNIINKYNKMQKKLLLTKKS